jgi:hypothetical protein
MTEQRAPFTHGGPRPGAGPKPRHGQPMVQKTIRLPQAWIDQLIAEYGSFQAALETLVQDHVAHKSRPSSVGNPKQL